MAVSGLLKSLQSPRRKLSLRSTNYPTQAKTGLEWAIPPDFSVRKFGSK